MSDLTNAAKDVYKATQEAKNAIDNYNKYCQDFNNAQSYNNEQKTALAAVRLLEAGERLLKLDVPLTGDPAKTIAIVKIIKDKYFDQYGAQSIAQEIPYYTLKFDPDTADFFKKEPKKSPVDNFTCPTIDYPIPPAPVTKDFIDEIKDTAKTWWERAKNFIPRRDPLTFDLNGNGLETTAIAATNPILFDHDGDGVKNGTGWVKPDDGFLVLDKNGNGTIDNGRELFGDSTIKSNGQTAKDGFDALADLDSNADGIISSADTQFANLRIWRDLNQDGISQTGDPARVGRKSETYSAE